MGWTHEKRAEAAARMKARHADPEFRAAVAARMKALHADPEFRAACGFVDVPPHLKKYAAKLRSCGIRGDDLRAAIDAEIKKQEGR